MEYGPLTGEKIRRLRESRRWSQRKLALLANVSNGYLSRLERGDIPRPSVTTLSKLSGQLGVPVSELTDNIQPLDMNAEVFQDMARRIAMILPNVHLDDPEDFIRRTASLPGDGQALMERLLFTVEDHFRSKMRKERSYTLAVEGKAAARLLGTSDTGPLDGLALEG